MAWGDMPGGTGFSAGATGAAGQGTWGRRGLGMRSTNQAGQTGAALGMGTMGTPGHDTHPMFSDPSEGDDPSRRFFHDRRSAGRRHTPRFGEQDGYLLGGQGVTLAPSHRVGRIQRSEIYKPGLPEPPYGAGPQSLRGRGPYN